MKELSRRQYFLVLLACSGLAACALGTITNVNGIFFKPVSDSLNVGRGAISLAATLTAITTGFLGPLTIKAMQKFSLKKILLISAVTTAASTIGMAFAGSLWLYDILSILRGASSAFFGIPVITVIMGNWFVKKRGMLTGIVMSCSGVVGAVLSPLLSTVINLQGYRMGYIICAILMLLFTLPGILILSASPDQIGGKAYGESIDLRNAEYKIKKEAYFTYEKGSMLFISLCLMAFLCQSVCSISQHLAGYAESVGQNSMVGAVMISAAMVGNIIAKFAVGVLSDYMGAVKSACILIAAFLLGLLVLTVFENQEVMLLAGSFLLGTSYACALMLSNLTFAVYGTKQYGEVFSLLTVILNIGGSLAIAIVGYGYDLFQTYAVILWAGIGMTIFAMILLAGISLRMKKNGK